MPLVTDATPSAVLSVVSEHLLLPEDAAIDDHLGAMMNIVGLTMSDVTRDRAAMVCLRTMYALASTIASSRVREAARVHAATDVPPIGWRDALADALAEASGPTQDAHRCPRCDEEMCVCWIYDDATPPSPPEVKP